MLSEPLQFFRNLLCSMNASKLLNNLCMRLRIFGQDKNESFQTNCCLFYYKKFTGEKLVTNDKRAMGAAFTVTVDFLCQLWKMKSTFYS